MRRRLLNLLTALSLLLCVAVVVLWVWSYYAVPLESHFAGLPVGDPLQREKRRGE